MKSPQVLVLTAVLVLTVSGLSLAQMDKGKDTMGDKGMGMMGHGMMKDDMMGKEGMMGGKKMGMCPMMQSMRQQQVVATSDGGIIVVGGNKITKYDKDLNVVKEVEQKIDMKGMEKMMEDCPMMNKGMGHMGNDAETTAEKTAPAKEVDHASHH